MGRGLGLLFFATALFAKDQILYHAKIFTADPQNPYSEAVAIRGDKILAVGTLPEVEKAAPHAIRSDLEGRSLFPGFIDSHSHAIDGGFNLTNADATEKVDTFLQLQAFVAEAKTTKRGMHGDILEIVGLPLKFWSHTDILNQDFNTGPYEKQCLIFRGMDGHTAWANRAMLQRVGITADYLKTLNADQRSYFGFDKNFQPNGFLVDQVRTKSIA